MLAEYARAVAKRRVVVVTAVIGVVAAFAFAAFNGVWWIAGAVLAAMGIVLAQFGAWRDMRRERDQRDKTIDALKSELAATHEQVRMRAEREDVRLRVVPRANDSPARPGVWKLSLDVHNEGASSNFAAQVVSEVKGVLAINPHYGPGIDIAWEGQPEPTRRIARGTQDELFLGEYNPARQQFCLIGPASIYSKKGSQTRWAAMMIALRDTATFEIEVRDVDVDVARRFYVSMRPSEKGDGAPKLNAWSVGTTPHE